jgi:hypothetical protein
VKPDQMIPSLEALADRLGITIRYEGLAASGVSGTGGLCKVRGAHWLIIDKKSTPSERVAILVDALAGFQTEEPARELGLPDRIEEMLILRRAAKGKGDAAAPGGV